MKTALSRRNLTAESHHQPDFCIHKYGTIYLFEPVTEQAVVWLQEYFRKNEKHTYVGSSLAVGHRFIADVVVLAVCDGLVSPVELWAEEGSRFKIFAA